MIREKHETVLIALALVAAFILSAQVSPILGASFFFIVNFSLAVAQHKLKVSI